MTNIDKAIKRQETILILEFLIFLTTDDEKIQKLNKLKDYFNSLL